MMGVRYSARARKHPAPPPSSFPIESDAERRCASTPLRWFRDSSRPRNPGSTRSLRPYHVRAEEGPAVFVKDHLDQALVLAERDRLPVAHERKAADSNVELLILRSLLGETDRSN